MHSTDGESTRLVFVLDRDGSLRYVVYNASELGNPDDHVPDKWYFLPYPPPIGSTPGEPFDSAREAEASARARLDPN